MAAITIILLCTLYLNHSFACAASPRELVVVPATLLIHILYLLFSCDEICYCQLTTNREGSTFSDFHSLCARVCVCVCLLGTHNSWYEAAWLIQADWKIVRIIIGFMEIYFAVMCGGKSNISSKNSLTVVHVRTDTGFFE